MSFKPVQCSVMNFKVEEEMNLFEYSDNGERVYMAFSNKIRLYICGNCLL